MHLQTLGELTLVGSDFTRPKGLYLLAYLALEGTKSRQHLQQMFFAESADPSATLRVLLSQLRKACGATLEDKKGQITLTLPCDATTMLEALPTNPLEAVSHYQAMFLEGELPKDPEFEHWVLATRERLAQTATDAHLKLSETALTESRHNDANQHAAAAYRISSQAILEPQTLLRLWKVLSQTGSALQDKIRLEMQDLGMVLPAAAPEPVAPKTKRSSATSFVERPELPELEQMVQQHRLVTVLGYGGSGKTRLALEALHSLAPHFAASHKILLETADTTADVLGLLLRTFSLEGAAEPWEELAEQIGQQKMLLVLDNLEQVIEVAESLEGLLENCPNLHLICTSRERLALPSETVLRLGGLPPAAAEQLFFERTPKSKSRELALPHVSELQTLLALVEYYPLGVELCAGLSAVMPVPELLENLQHSLDALEGGLRKKRHSGLRAVFDWSWSLLTRAEQQTLARLSVFTEPPSREQALLVADTHLVALLGLVGKCLLSVQEGAYRLHPLILEFCREKLYARPQEHAVATERHAKHFLGWLETHAPHTRTDRAAQVLGFFEAHFENICSSWRWLCQHPDPKQFERLEDVVQCFDARARFAAGAELFAAAVEVLTALPKLPKLAVAQLEVNTAWLLHRADRNEEALSHIQNAFAYLHKKYIILHLKVLNTLAVIQRGMGKYQIASQIYEEILKFSSIEPVRLAIARVNLASVLLHLGKIEASNLQYKLILNSPRLKTHQNIYLDAVIGLSFSLIYVQNAFLDPELPALIQNGIQISREISDVSREIDLQIRKLFLDLFNSQFESVVKFNHQLKETGKISLYEAHPFFQIVLAKLSFEVEKFDLGVFQLFQAYSLALKLKNSVFIAAVLNEVGLVMLSKNKLTASKVFHFTKNETVFPIWARDEAQKQIELHQLPQPNYQITHMDLYGLVKNQYAIHKF